MFKKIVVSSIISFLICLFLITTNASALPITFIKTPSNDVDKVNDAGNWTTNWYDDLDGDNQWDKNEPWADSSQTSWSNPEEANDMSCWLASAANMLAAQGYNNGNELGIYDELLDHYGWTEGGWQHEALDWYIFDNEGMNPSYKVNYYGVYTGTESVHNHITASNQWPQNPYDFVKKELYRCQQVGIVLHTSSLYHAVTFYGWTEIFSIITDSDTDTDHYSNTDRNYYLSSSSQTDWKIDYLQYNQINVPIDYFTTLCPIPEPATILLFSLGILGLAGISRKKR
ncbi:PEP-CTERM sorting domain-containing protein [Desulfobacula sp.]|uniref:PEP-CTERM sorting domain-containing protein n=1 Tax=Desulfobacula sp. TaxID=2593537 RepID=UPI002624FD54|nr:PEP-CTERM sorting domain-containing protein [Desulfobacula sp.]